MPALRLPPGPPELPIIGHAKEYMRDPLDFPLHCARQYGDVVRFRVLNMVAYQLNHPDLIEEVLVKQHHNFTKDRFTADLKLVLGNGLLVNEGESWRRQRRLAQPPFHHRQIHGYGSVMVECTRAMLQSWRPDQVVDIHGEMMRLTMEIVARTLFGTDIGQDAETAGHAIEVVMRHYVGLGSLIRALAPRWLGLFNRLPTPSNLRRKRAVAQLDRVIYRIIAQRRADPAPSDDLLSRLLQAQDDDGYKMSDQQLRDESVTLFAAGHETTALALSYTWYLLARHPESDERLQDELRDVLGGREPAAGDLSRLTYTEWVIKESMRLYPPAWGIGREAVAECEIGGYPVPAGTQISLLQWVVHRDPRFFPDPLVFRPERWDDASASQLPRFAYFPFGGGPRICIGNSFAMQEAVLLLATIAQRFRPVLVEENAELPLLPTITLRPRNGISMRLTPR